MKLQLQNVGEATITVKDLDGYSGFVADVAKGETKTYDVTRDLVQRLAPRLVEMESLVKDPNQNDLVIVGLRWSVLSSADVDDRAMNEGLAGLPSLNEYQAASYSTGAGGSDVIATGTGLLGNQVKASLAIVEGSGQLDLEAVNPGAPGNGISVEIIVGVGALGINVVANKIEVTTQAAGDTINDIANAINGDADAKLLVQASVGAAGSLTAAQAEKYLDGGVGPGVSLTLNGTACVLTEVLDGQLTFNIPTGISAANRIIPLEYRNGPHVSRLSVPVVA